MASVEFDLLCAFETHAVGEIREILDAGFDAKTPIRGKSPMNHLLEMYSRSDDFPGCVELLLDRGAVLDDPVIAPVLLNDLDALAHAIRATPSLLKHRTSLVSSFTPLVGATLLHVAAEYGHIDVVRLLIEKGADVNARAAFDDHGLNGHTPIFHTVNSNGNRSATIMSELIAAGAQCDMQLKGITWGKGFEWETTLFDVTPISYAQFGLLPQVHRRDRDIYANIKCLLAACNRTIPPLDNVPNRYLKPKAGS